MYSDLSGHDIGTSPCKYAAATIRVFRYL
jgi:hypothetical protein